MDFSLFLCYNFRGLEEYMNYDFEMEKQLKNITEGEKLLLHVCCAPCSSAVLERLGDFFEITIFYYNPNITDEDEYRKRILEVKHFVSSIHPRYKVSIMEGRYEPEIFFDMAKGLEKERERGRRCFKCYELRLGETAKIAESLGFNYFCTTLTLSPHKNSNWINEIGEKLNQKYKTNYLYSDFKKKNGYKRSIELSKKYHLYRQNYCGCIYSKKAK